jgi:hypothetical protein
MKNYVSIIALVGAVASMFTDGDLTLQFVILSYVARGKV